MWRRLVLLLLLAGCTSAPSAAPPPTAQVPSPTITGSISPRLEAAQQLEVPAVIDLAYVQRVLETIYHLDGEATRHVYAKKVPDAELNERLEAIFGDPALSEAKRVLGENAADGFVRFADPPGDAEVRALEILQATATCMVIRADLQYGPQFKDARPPQQQAAIQLARADVVPLNPTGWGVVVAGVPKQGQHLKVCR